MSSALLGPVLLAVAAGPPVDVELSAGCAAFDAAEVRRRLAVELRAAGTQAQAPWATRVEAACDGLVAHLTVHDPLSRKVVSRAVDLSRVGADVRSRTLAVAAAELVLASWSELVAQPEPEVPAAMPEPPLEQVEEARRVAAERLRLERSLRLLAEGAASVFTAGGLALFGGGARIGWERHRVLGAELEARFELGSARFETGVVNAQRATLGVAVHARATLGGLTLRALVGLRGGLVVLSGVAAAGSTRAGSGAGPWLGLPLGIAAARQLGPVSVELGLELGVPILGVVGLVYGEPRVRLDGLWLGARLAVGFFP